MSYPEGCPVCGESMYGKVQLLSTVNEWKHYCPICDIRFNDAGKVRPDATRTGDPRPKGSGEG